MSYCAFCDSGSLLTGWRTDERLWPRFLTNVNNVQQNNDNVNSVCQNDDNVNPMYIKSRIRNNHKEAVLSILIDTGANITMTS